MGQPKRVLSIMDLSSVGRAGLSAALPVLSACGVQACGLPSALFSTHMGFPGPEVLDAAAFCEGALDQWLAEGVTFDAVLTGYLNTQAQFEMASRALSLWPDALRVVDPAMGDGGKPYGGLPKDAPARMASLCAAAHLCTPNTTESAMLCGEDPAAVHNEEDARRMLHALLPTLPSVLITSAPGGPTGTQMLGHSPEDGTFALPVRQVPGSYPGTGDAFTAALVGLHLQGLPLPQAAAAAGAFIEAAVRATHEGGGEARQGVWFEAALPLLREAL